MDERKRRVVKAGWRNGGAGWRKGGPGDNFLDCVCGISIGNKHRASSNRKGKKWGKKLAVERPASDRRIKWKNEYRHTTTRGILREKVEYIAACDVGYF